MVTVGLVWVNFCPALWVNYTPAVTSEKGLNFNDLEKEICEHLFDNL
jgi:hypothetical protein